jgi:hypothetical protein
MKILLCTYTLQQYEIYPFSCPGMLGSELNTVYLCTPCIFDRLHAETENGIVELVDWPFTFLELWDDCHVHGFGKGLRQPSNITTSRWNCLPFLLEMTQIWSNGGICTEGSSRCVTLLHKHIYVLQWLLPASSECPAKHAVYLHDSDCKWARTTLKNLFSFAKIKR